MSGYGTRIRYKCGATISTPDRDSSPDLLVIDILKHCESDTLNHLAIVASQVHPVIPRTTLQVIAVAVTYVCLSRAVIMTNVVLPLSLNQCVLKLCSSNLAGIRLMMVSVSGWKSTVFNRDVSEIPLRGEHSIGDVQQQRARGFHLTYRDVTGQLIGMLNEELSWSVMIPSHRITYSEFTVEAIGAYLILLDMCEVEGVMDDLVMQLNILSDDESWNPRGSFIVVVTADENRVWSSEIPPLDGLVTRILEQVWMRYIYNCIVVLPVTTNVARYSFPIDCESFGFDNFIGIYSWSPYGSPRCTRHVETVTMLNLWSTGKDGHFLNDTKPFDNKVPNTFKWCPLVVSTFKYEPYVFPQRNDPNTTYGVSFDEGFEIRLIRLIADFLKFKIIYTTPKGSRWGNILSNGTATGITGDIIYQKADVVFGACALITAKTRGKIESTTYYYKESIKWFVPCARPIPRWMSLSRIFSSMLWLIVFLSLILGSGVFWVLARLSEFPSSGTLSAFDSVEMTWSTILQVPTSSKLFSIAFRIFFLHWLFYSLLVNTAYRSFLIGILANPGRQHQIATVEEILDSGMDVGFSSYFDSLAENMDSERYNEILRRRIDSEDLSYYYGRMALNEDFAGVSDTLHLRYMSSFKVIDQDGNSFICLFREGLLNYYISMMFHKGNPVLFRFNQIINRAFQSGFIDFWIKNLLDTSKLKDKTKKYSSSGGSSYVITLSHLQGAFYLLTIGLILGVATFVWEAKDKIGKPKRC